MLLADKGYCFLFIIAYMLISTDHEANRFDDIVIINHRYKLFGEKHDAPSMICVSSVLVVVCSVPLEQLGQIHLNCFRIKKNTHPILKKKHLNLNSQTSIIKHINLSAASRFSVIKAKQRDPAVQYREQNSVLICRRLKLM